MKIEQIDKQTIKVILTQNDMELFDITYEEMDYKDPNTKRVILELLHQIKKETAVDLNNGKLFIEAFPHSEGGCVLYICAIEPESAPKKRAPSQKSGFNTPLVFEFPSLELLTAASIRLFKQYNHIILKSVLYLLEQKYRLLLYSYFKMDDKLIGLVSEYGRYVGKGIVQASLVREHAKLLIASDALEIICDKLS